MNYLSHFYVHQELGLPYYNLGLILPDLGRGFVKTFKNCPVTNDIDFEQMLTGCLQHYEADKVFHASAFFEWGSDICIEALKAAQFEEEVDRRWFIGHVLFEMLVDRILVRHKPSVILDFYNNLLLADPQKVLNFFNLNQAKESERFLQNFVHFRKVQYIKNYPDNNLFVYSLSRVLMRAHLPPLSIGDRLVMQQCLLELENSEFKRVDELFLKLKSVFE